MPAHRPLAPLSVPPHAADGSTPRGGEAADALSSASTSFKGEAPPGSVVAATSDPNEPLKMPQVRVPPLQYRQAPMPPGQRAATPPKGGATPPKRSFFTAEAEAPAQDDAGKLQKTPSATTEPSTLPAAAPEAAAVPLQTGYVFVPRKGETPAEALRRKLREQKAFSVAAANAPTSAASKNSKHDDDEEEIESRYLYHSQKLLDDDELDVVDRYKPNIFFQNGRFSGAAPRPEQMPRHQQLPEAIHFYVRTTDVPPPDLYRPLPEATKAVMLEARTVKGHESAGPLARVDFSEVAIVGLGVRRDAVLAGHSQLVIDVPSAEAFAKQDVRVRPTSYTFQPYHQSSLHGDWLPRVNVPVLADHPKPPSPEQALRRKPPPPPKVKRLLACASSSSCASSCGGSDADGADGGADDLGEAGREVANVGNPYAPVESSAPAARASRSERRLAQSARRMNAKGCGGVQTLAHSSAAATALGAGGLRRSASASKGDGRSDAMASSYNSSAGGGGLQSLLKSSCGSCASLMSQSLNSSYGAQSLASSLGRGSQLSSSLRSLTGDAPPSLPPSPDKAGGGARHERSGASAGTALGSCVGTTPRLPMSGRSQLASARTSNSGVSGGPQDRDLWPRDFAADTAREQTLDELRAVARKEREIRLQKEREQAREARAARLMERRDRVSR